MSESGLFAFPPPESLETPRVLRALIDAHRHLAELKGMARSIPNSRLLISTLSLQEAQSSSEIENIITTQDALYRYRIQPESADPVSKEVAWYAQGLDAGFEAVRVKGKAKPVVKGESDSYIEAINKKIDQVVQDGKEKKP